MTNLQPLIDNRSEYRKKLDEFYRMKSLKKAVLAQRIDGSKAKTAFLRDFIL